MDMNEEDIIRKITDGTPNPFRVPEGYFDEFTSRLMTRLPEQQKPGKSSLISRAWRYAAVLVVALGLGITYLVTERRAAAVAETAQQEPYQEDYINDALDYAMVDNSHIELYLTEAQ